MTAPEQAPRGYGFGTAPVFLASISTILGAVMFLRFGYAVGHTGILGAMAIVVVGHLVTIPTALAIAEIATNRRVEGGGEYFIISRSFGTTIGGAIGISLYMSQAISVAFYMIAFGEAFSPLVGPIEAWLGTGFDLRFISLPGLLALTALVVTRGADLGVRALYVVATILFISLALFFAGGPIEGYDGASTSVVGGIADADPFMLVFAICFPAFTGMTAGVGLSGDLANPRRSIPLGILSATLAGMIVYAALILKLGTSAPPAALASDQLVMSRIALWGPVIPIGLAMATLSSAIGSIVVAPRTLQALAADRVVPVEGANRFLSTGVGLANDPRNATLVTALLAVVFVVLGSVDLVARIVSMFFMVTYGALCAISFLEHFAARPSYRPSFRSTWWVSLFGAVACLVLMLQMDLPFAMLAIVVMVGLYLVIRRSRADASDDLAEIFHGVMTQATRWMQIKLQKTAASDWRPSVILITPRTFDRHAPMEFLEWLCHRYGFGTYLHHIRGLLDSETYDQSQEVQRRLLAQTRERSGGIFVDTMISPSMESALAQSLQMPGISGMDNNTVLFEFSVHDDPSVPEAVVAGTTMAGVAHMNRLVLRHTDHFFGNRRSIHVWLTWHDYRNANLMILLAYILLGHPEWRRGEIRLYAAYPKAEVKERTAQLKEMIRDGRLLITDKNLQVFATDDRTDFSRLVEVKSESADLVIRGFTQERVRKQGPDFFAKHPGLRDVLFVSSEERIFIE
ncbi:MAG: amino acid permease [Gemmatimonadetes bacterium]|nr:amino acid permease [Gemmatimonadota bacterium]